MKRLWDEKSYFASVPASNSLLTQKLYEFSKSVGEIHWGKGERGSFILKFIDSRRKPVSVYYVYNVGSVWFPFQSFKAKYHNAYQTFMEELHAILGIWSDSGNPTCPVHRIVEHFPKFTEAVRKFKEAIQR